MMQKKKYGWTAIGFVGMVFTPMGLFFLIMAGMFWHFQVGDRSGDTRILLAVFGGMGLIFLAIGLGLLLADVRRRASQRRAYESGYYVMARIAGINLQRNTNMNGRYPVVVECHYTDPATGIAHIYYSRYLYVNVADLLEGDEVPVYIDRMNDNVGFVDIDAVLPKIQIHK